jgi:hypothetical protein
MVTRFGNEVAMYTSEKRESHVLRNWKHDTCGHKPQMK